MKIRKFKKRYWVTLVGVILLYIAATAGPLLPWSPLKPGYDEYLAETYSVHYPSQKGMPEYYKDLDAYIQANSKQFNLPVKKKIKLIRTDKASLQKYLPWMKTDNLGGVALQTGDVLYISYEKIEERGLQEEEFVRHEIIHLLHHQNANIINSFNAGKITYLSEGVPFYSGGPKYYSREEWLERLKKAKLEEATTGDSLYIPDAFSMYDPESGDEYRVSHMLYGEFIKYVIDMYGQEKFNTFNLEYLKTPSLHRELFEETYDKKLEVVAQEFETTLSL